MWTYKGDAGAAAPKKLADLQKSGITTQAYQIGIVSRGEGCAYRNFPGVFTKIAEFEHFIKEKMAPGGCLKYKDPT